MTCDNKLWSRRNPFLQAENSAYGIQVRAELKDLAAGWEPHGRTTLAALKQALVEAFETSFFDPKLKTCMCGDASEEFLVFSHHSANVNRGSNGDPGMNKRAVITCWRLCRAAFFVTRSSDG